MKTFLAGLLAVIVGTFLVFFLWIFILLGIAGSMEKSVAVHPESILKIDFSEVLTDAPSSDPLAGIDLMTLQTTRQLSLFKALRAIEAAGADEGYRTAFYVEIGILVLSVLAVFIGVLNIVTSILSLVVIYLVCTTTAGLLEVKGDLGTAARGRFAWKFYGGCTALVVVCSILSLIPLVNILAMVVIVPASIASVVGGILLLIFLYRACKSLRY